MKHDEKSKTIEKGSGVDPSYDNSAQARENFATGNPHYDCQKYGAESTRFLCHLASDRDAISAEAALNRLRQLLDEDGMDPHLSQVYETVKLILYGSENRILKAAARKVRMKLKQLRARPAVSPKWGLNCSTGSAQRDRLLSGVVCYLKNVFGSRMLAVYLVGSIVDGSAVQSSDIDLHVLFRGAHTQRVKKAMQVLSTSLSLRYRVDLDMSPFFESDLNPCDVRTKLGGIQLFGEPISDKLVLPDINVYIRESMHRALYYQARARGLPDNLSYPFSAPDTSDRFCGYNSRVHEDGTPSTKELVVVAGWISTALVALAAKCYIASKADTYKLYRAHINDQWMSHLEDVFELVRKQWNYRLPETEEELEKLASICRKQVEFENHFLLEYRKFLEQEKSTDDSHSSKQACKLLSALFPVEHGPTAGERLLLPIWQMSTRARRLDPRLVSVDHFIVKAPSMRNLSDKLLREAFQRFEEFGAVIFACRDSEDLKYELLGLQENFGTVVSHPRSDKTGVSSVRKEFRPKDGFVGTTSNMQTAHTDGSFRRVPPGIVALQPEICGLCGGESTLVFGDALYKHMQQFPRELQSLFAADAYTIDREEESCTRPVFWDENGRIHLAYRNGNGERLAISPGAHRGFNRIYDFVNDPANQLRFRLPTNYILVVDNHRNLHGRMRWLPDTVRRLNRLWLDGVGSHPLYPGLGIRI